MAQAPHRVQHKPRRESKEVEVKAENQQLRSQNQKLRRENARLRREMEKRIPSAYPVVEEELTTPMAVAPEVKKADACPECGSEGLKRVKLPTKMLTACPDCGWRRAA